MRRLILLAAIALPLGGCISTAASIITAPVRAVGQVADWTTTSQEESDRNRGRMMREREAELGRLQRRRDREAERCERGDADACDAVERYDLQMADLRGEPSTH